MSISVKTCRLRCDAVQSGRNVLAFVRNLRPQSSESTHVSGSQRSEPTGAVTPAVACVLYPANERHSRPLMLLVAFSEKCNQRRTGSRGRFSVRKATTCF
jgi:hypothetical protein